MIYDSDREGSRNPGVTSPGRDRPGRVVEETDGQRVKENPNRLGPSP